MPREGRCWVRRSGPCPGLGPGRVGGVRLTRGFSCAPWGCAHTLGGHSGPHTSPPVPAPGVGPGSPAAGCPGRQHCQHPMEDRRPGCPPALVLRRRLMGPQSGCPSQVHGVKGRPAVAWVLSLASQPPASGRGCISTAWCPGGAEPRGGLVFSCPLPGVSRPPAMAVALLRAPRCGLGCEWAALGAGPSATGPWTLECFLPRSGVAGLGRAAPLLAPPPPLALLAAAAGALAARPIRSLCVRRTETKQNKLVSWPEQRHTRRGGALQRGSLPVSPSQGSWLSAATSCRLLFYIWYFEKSMMTVNGVRGRGGAWGCPEPLRGLRAASSG